MSAHVPRASVAKGLVLPSISGLTCDFQSVCEVAGLLFPTRPPLVKRARRLRQCHLFLCGAQLPLPPGLSLSPLPALFVCVRARVSDSFPNGSFLTSVWSARCLCFLFRAFLLFATPANYVASAKNAQHPNLCTLYCEAPDIDCGFPLCKPERSRWHRRARRARRLHSRNYTTFLVSLLRPKTHVQ